LIVREKVKITGRLIELVSQEKKKEGRDGIPRERGMKKGILN